MIDGMERAKKGLRKGMAKATKEKILRHGPKTARTPKKELKAKKVGGIVFKIANGKPTNEKLAAEKAFGDLAQAREQVLYAERHGSIEEKRLVRLAFRQYQNKRFRKG
jgi:hypothetical protein